MYELADLLVVESDSDVEVRVMIYALDKSYLEINGYRIMCKDIYISFVQ